MRGQVVLEFSDHGGQHFADLLAEVFCVCPRKFVSEVEAAWNDELRFDFVVGTASVTEELEVLAGGAASVTSRYVAGDGDRGAPLPERSKYSDTQTS